MDFIGSRAIPALIALACAPAFGAADCASLDGTYRVQAAATSDGEPRYLSTFASGLGRNKLYRMEPGGTGPKGLSPAAPIQRPKVTQLAATAALTYAPKKTRLRFADGQGNVLAELGIDFPDPWTCSAGRLQRSSNRTSGLGDVVRTERIEETLERNAAGDLLYRETRSVVGGKPQRNEARFPAVR